MPVQELVVVPEQELAPGLDAPEEQEALEVQEAQALVQVPLVDPVQEPELELERFHHQTSIVVL